MLAFFIKIESDDPGQICYHWFLIMPGEAMNYEKINGPSQKWLSSDQDEPGL